MSLINIFEKAQLKKSKPNVKPGDLVKVFQKNLDKEGGKPQVFKGIVLARKHGKGLTSTITVRREVKGVGVERIFPLHSPLVEKIEIVKRGKVRRAKLYYLRKAKGKKRRIKTYQVESVEEISSEETTANEEDALTQEKPETSTEKTEESKASSTQGKPETSTEKTEEASDTSSEKPTEAEKNED